MLIIENVNRIIHKRKNQKLGSFCLILLTLQLKTLKQKKSPKRFLYITVTFSPSNVAGSYQPNVNTAFASVSWAHHRDKAAMSFYEYNTKRVVFSSKRNLTIGQTVKF